MTQSITNLIKNQAHWRKFLPLLMFPSILLSATIWTLNARASTHEESIRYSTNITALTNAQDLQTHSDFPLSNLNPWVSSDNEASYSVAWGDVDGDGDLDLAVGNSGYNEDCSCYLGAPNRLYLNNEGTLQPAAVWLSADTERTLEVAWGDVDGDGDLDLAAADRSASTKVYFNVNGMLQTTAGWESEEADNKEGVAWGDVDGDGDLDLAVATFYGPNRLYLNTNGTLSTSSNWNSNDADGTTSLAWGDIDHDGDLDLVAGNHDGANKIYLNIGGILQTTASWNSGDTNRTNEIMLGDVNGDGYLDLAAANEPYHNEGCNCDVTGQNKVYLNQNGILQTEADNPWRSGDEDLTTAVDWGDVDGDGDLDLAVGNIFDPNKVYLNENGILQTAADNPWSMNDFDSTFDIAWGDVDGDGDLDLATVQAFFDINCNCYIGEDNKVYFNNNGFMETAAADIYISDDSDYTFAIAFGDVDGDEDLDLAVGNTIYDPNCDCYSGDTNKIYLNDDGVFASTASWESNESEDTTSIAWGDIDNDGDLDLAVGNWEKPNQTYQNQGGILTASASWTSADSDKTFSVAWGDVDNDGDLDLAVGNYASANKIYFNNDGVIASTASWQSDETDPTFGIAWGDVDNDGDLDLAVADRFKPNKLYLNDNGVLQKSASWHSEDANSTFSVAWGDVDGDGDLDLAAGNQFGPNKVYLNQNGVLQTAEDSPWNSGDSDRTIRIAWGDVNGDGALDLVASNENSSIKIYLNKDGVLQTAEDHPWVSKDTTNTVSIALGDVDHDGDLDLASGNNGPNKVYINHAQGGSGLSNAHSAITVKRPITPYITSFYAPPQLITTNVIPISYKLFDYEENNIGQIKAEYSLNGGGQWFPAVATQATIITNLEASAWPTGTEHIYYWDTFASGFFGQSDNVVFRIEAYSQPASSAANGTYQYTNLTPFPIQRPYASATSFPFRVRGTQVQVFSETISAENAVPDAIVYRQSNGGLSDPMASNIDAIPFTTDSNGYLSGRGQLDIGDQLFATLPMTTTYRTPPQLIFSNADGLGNVKLNTPPTQTVTAEFWLLPTAGEGTLFTLGGLTLSNPLNLTINGQSTGINIGDGFPHHVALSWQDSNNAWNLVVDGESKANGVTNISLDNSLFLGDGYSGSLDEIRLWNTVRSSAQISQTLFTPLTGNESGLIGYWPVKERDSGVVEDTSGHGNDLSLSGNVAVYYNPLYTVYHTSGAPTPSGVSMFEVTEPGVQQLVVSKDNPLMLFDLDVSLEWDASGDSDYLDRLDKDIKRASEILYDLTNGQVAFGQINVYQDKELWDQADIQVYANNNQRPNANLGGIVTNYLTDTLKTGEVVGNAFLPGKIRIGATWNRYGNPGGTVGEDWPRVLAHEFGHYGLFLLDNYLGVEEVDGSKIIVEVDCAGSAMTDAYRQDYSEALSETANSAGHSWQSSECQKTLAEDTTGRSDWETIRHFYPFLKENIVSTQAGPTSLPLAVTQVTIHEPTNGQELLTTPVFYINDTAGNLIPFTRGEGQAYLYQSNGTADPEDDDILYLGSPSGPLINARGAAVGDRLCVFDNGHKPPRVGCLDNLQNSGATLTLAEVDNWQPAITVRPVNSTTLAVTVIQAGVGKLHVQIFPSYRPTDTIKALTGQLTKQPNGDFTGEFQFPITVFDGFIRVWEEGNENHESISRFANAPGWDGNTFVGFGGNRFIAWGGNRFVAWGGNTFVGFGGNRFIAWGGNRFVGFGGNTFVGFGGNRFVGFGGNTFVGFNAPLASPDGQVILYNVDNILAGNVAASLQVLPSVPQLRKWLTPIGQVYRYTTPENEGDNLVIQFQYLQRELPAIEENQLRIYYLDENDPNAGWQRLENTTIDDFRNLASAKMPGEGLYALIATVELPRFYEGWNLFGYLINENRDVAPALESIDGAYNSVYHYDAATKDWLLYDATVVLDNPEFAPLVNDLVQLETGKGYWLYATKAITAYLGVANGSSLDMTNQQFPPATYYGYVLPHEGFQPTAGTEITAWINGVNCGQSLVELLNGQLVYTVQIQAEDTSGHCGTAGKLVTFQVGDWTMAQQPQWDNSQAQFLTLSTLAITWTVYLPVIMRP